MNEKPNLDFSMGDVQKEMAQAVGEMYDNLGPPKDADPGLTSKEYAKLWGVSYVTARRRLVVLEEKGLIIAGQRYVRLGGNGRWWGTPVYRPKENI